MNETTNKYDNPILICIGSHKDFHDDGELFCGGCGYQYSPDEAEAMFKDVKIKVADTCGMEVHTKPLRCIRCCRRYENLLHYNGGARLTEYMNRIRRRRLNTR